MRMLKDFAALVCVGAWLLVTVSGCESSKHAEIMSTEDLRKQMSMAAAPETEGDQSGISFEGRSIPQESLGLSESFSFAPEPPPSPMLSSRAQESVTPPAKEQSPAPAVEEDIVQAEEPPESEPAMQIAELKPSDLVAEAAPVLEQGGPVVQEKSGLADVFFDFDKYTIRPDAVPTLEENAKLLNHTYKNSNVLIEGHCDERGTVEYNLELGKRRAQAVKDYLLDLGIAASRIKIVSYGKERPFCTESQPSCWQKNRRGHFVRQ